MNVRFRKNLVVENWLSWNFYINDCWQGYSVDFLHRENEFVPSKHGLRFRDSYPTLSEAKYVCADFALQEFKNAWPQLKGTSALLRF